MGIMESFQYYYNHQADPRTSDWLLNRSAWTPALITLIYLFVVLKLAPDFMKNRPAYQLNTFIKCYNLFQVIINAYLIKEFASCFHFSRTFECQPLVYSLDPCSIKILNAVYITLLLKIFDMIETVVFILRKKNNQASILHVYHHISAVFIAMLFVRFLSMEMYVSMPILNCSIHVIMYFYYFLSNFESSIKQKIIPFKRYLTTIQMVQFLIFIAQLLLFLQESCPVPKMPTLLILLNIIMNLIMFFNFYKKSYSSVKSRTRKEKEMQKKI